MNFLDIIFLIPLLFGAVIGFRRGVVKEILALVAVVMAVYVARYFSPVLSGFLINHLSISRETAYPLGYILVLVIFGGGMYFLAEMLTRLLKAMKLGTLNHIFGGVLGLTKWALIISAILCFFAIVDRFIPIKTKPAVQQSLLYHPLESFIPTILPLIYEEALTNPEEPACSTDSER